MRGVFSVNNGRHWYFHAENFCMKDVCVVGLIDVDREVFDVFFYEN